MWLLQILKDDPDALNIADSIVPMEVHVITLPLVHHIGLVHYQDPDENYQPLLAHISLSIL